MNEQNSIPQGQYVDTSAISFLSLINLLLERKWLIVTVTLLVTLGGVFYLLTAKKIYQVNSLVQIDQTSKGIKGELEPIEAMLSGELPSEGEIEIIRSRSVIEPVVLELGLHISATPKKLPLIGGLYSRILYSDDSSKLVNPPLDLFKTYAWGGEAIKVSQLEVPDSMIETWMTLVCEADETFSIYDENDKLIIKGRVGEDISKGKFKLTVSMLKARNGTRFMLKRNSTYEVTNDLINSLDISEQGLKTGIINITYESADVSQAITITNRITDEYIKQNVQKKTAEATRTLEFISSFAPQSKKDLEQAESTLNTFREKHRSVQLDMETQELLDHSSRLKKLIEESEIELIGMKTTYMANNPLVINKKEKIAQLEKELVEIQKQMSALPSVQQDLLRLQREVDVKSELYTYLLQEAQSLKLIEAGGVGDVRVIDYASKPYNPIRPLPIAVIITCIFFGFSFGVGIVVFLTLLHRGVDSADELENVLGMPVIANIPLISDKKELTELEPIHAIACPNEPTIESLRSFIVSLRMSLINAESNIIMFSGAAPNAGKSFISANVSVLLADKGNRVVLIDGDLRKGHLDKTFHKTITKGLTNVLIDEIELEQAIVPTAHKNLSLIPVGTFPHNPIELLESKSFELILQSLSEKFDYVIIDSPPILAVSDASVIAQMSGANFLVIRSGQSTVQNIIDMHKRFNITNVKIHGVLLNGITKKAIGSQAYNYYAQYYTSS